VKRENKAMVGVIAVACAACCAGPIIALVTALGLGAILGTVVFGIVGLLVGVAAIALVLVRRRRRRRQVCGATPTDNSVPVDAPMVRPGR
jgi:hypothetical protein